MAVEIQIKEDVVRAYLSGEIDHHSAAQIRETIDESIIQGSSCRADTGFCEGYFYGFLRNWTGNGAVSADAGNRRKGDFAKSSGSASKGNEAGRIGQAGRNPIADVWKDQN